MPGDFGRGNDIEINWIVSQGSADFRQKIRLNSGSNKGTRTLTHHPSIAASSVIRTALPLPGPPLRNSAFPQEAYFEIKISYCHGDDYNWSGKLKEGEKTKLIHENSNPTAHSETLVHVMINIHDISKIKELKSTSKDDGKGEAVILSVGLTAGGYIPLMLPGTYPGSIGFNSDGSVYLDEDWGKADKVIGCGFGPRQKKVFFMLDSELVHVINCKSEEFETPLHPTIAANDDVLVVVNFGQSAFAYGPANGQRTPNPCFIGPLVNSPAALGSTAMKLNLEYAKVCVEVLATYALPSIIVDLGNGNYVDVVVELDWAPPCCSSCVVFGHATNKCKKQKVVFEDVVQDVDVGPIVATPLVKTHVDTSSLVDVTTLLVDRPLASGLMQTPKIRDLNFVDNSVDNSVVVDIFGSAGLCVESEGDKVVNFPYHSDFLVLSSNKFDALCDVVEGRVHEEASRPERATAVGVADLMEKL
ncbi:hypothetical protein V6N12_051016 [Hibiscus sabdariffa]